MKINIKLDGGKTKLTAEGYPIVVYITHNYKERKWRTGHYAKQKEWNTKLAAPTRKHPMYYVLLDYLSKLKVKISSILMEASRRSIELEEVKTLLFIKNYKIFYEAGINSFSPEYKGTILGSLRSFNKYYPQATFMEITPLMVDRYISQMLKKGNKPGGVDSYIRSLRGLWNKLSNEPNPFAKKKIEIPETTKIVASNNDLQILSKAKLSAKGKVSGEHHYRNYWLLMFYLGGIDPEVLAKLRYDKHVIENRIVFNRNKGNSKSRCNNLIPNEAFKILKQYNCHPYLVPIYRSTTNKTFLGNFNRRFKVLCSKLELSVELRPKGARYTFIDRAQQVLIDERITAQIVGHKRKTTTSIYTNDFPQKVQDQAHLRIIDIN